MDDNSFSADSGRSPRCRNILQSALSCFAEEGFHRTTNKKIAARAGVAEGLLYHYFPDKEALLFAIIEEKFSKESSPIQKVYAEWEEKLEQGQISGKDLGVFLKQVGDATIASLVLHRDVFRIVVSEYRLLEKDREPLYPRMVYELSLNRFNRIVSVLAGWPEVRDVAQYFLGVLFSNFFFQEILSGKKICTVDNKIFLANLIDHFMKGLGPVSEANHLRGHHEVE
ncbi:MAG: TetR/AcrR family transcriptional regulator [Leptospirillum sp.]